MANYQINEQEYDNFIARVLKPQLEEEEKKAIREDIKAALVQLGREKMRRSKNV